MRNLRVLCGSAVNLRGKPGAVSFLGLVLFVPELRELFRFAELHWIDLDICLAAGVVSVTWFEAFKLWSRRRNNLQFRRAMVITRLFR